MHRPHLHIGLLIFIFLWGQGIVFAETRVRVGIFQNKPMSFMADSGEARGIYPDVIREIAQKENWEIEFIPDSWAGCLNRLESGKIDLMISIVRTSDRETRYDFTKIPVLTAWGQVYAKADHGISNILDLEAKTIGLMEKDINGKHFQDLARNFKINCNYKIFLGYDDLSKALLSAKVDAVVMNNMSGASFQRKYKLQPTAVLFSPIDTFLRSTKEKTDTFSEPLTNGWGRGRRTKIRFTIPSFPSGMGTWAPFTVPP